MAAEPQKLFVRSFRLRPGDDLLKGIANYVKEQQIQACHVVSCVGSLTQATLRLAKPKSDGEKERIRTREESFEIVGITGTAEWNAGSGKVTKHLHISLADEDGNVWGGHMLSNLDGDYEKTNGEGLYPIYTTAEVGLLVDEGSVIILFFLSRKSTCC